MKSPVLLFALIWSTCRCLCQLFRQRAAGGYCLRLQSGEEAGASLSVEDLATRWPEQAVVAASSSSPAFSFEASCGETVAPEVLCSMEEDEWEAGCPSVATGRCWANPSSGSGRNSSRCCCFYFFLRFVVAGERRLVGSSCGGALGGEGVWWRSVKALVELVVLQA